MCHRLRRGIRSAFGTIVPAAALALATTDGPKGLPMLTWPALSANAGFWISAVVAARFILAAPIAW